MARSRQAAQEDAARRCPPLALKSIALHSKGLPWLERLQQLDCGRPTDLITTRAISDTQLHAILAEAFKE